MVAVGVYATLDALMAIGPDMTIEVDMTTAPDLTVVTGVADDGFPGDLSRISGNGATIITFLA
jgi:hypothetical protein